MLTKLLMLCFLVCATGGATACICLDEEQRLLSLEKQGFPTGVRIFHGRVERWTNKKDVQVRVIEAFSGNRETKHLLVDADDSCRVEFSDREEAVYFPSEEGFINPCSRMSPSPENLDRLRAIAERSHSADLVARNEQRATDKKTLRTYRGKRLFQPAQDTLLSERSKGALARFGVRTIVALTDLPIHVDRLAIDAPVTVIVIGTKEYRFVGNLRTLSSPGIQVPVQKTVHYAIPTVWANEGVIDLWDGHTVSGDRAEITRDPWGLSGQIYLEGRRFQLATWGAFGRLRELDTPAGRAALARQPAAPEMTRRLPETGRTKPPTPLQMPNSVAANPQCADNARTLSMLDEAEGYPQPVHLQSYLAERRARVKRSMRELQC